MKMNGSHFLTLNLLLPETGTRHNDECGMGAKVPV